MAAKTHIKCDRCKRVYNLSSLVRFGEDLLCFYCKNGYKHPNFKNAKKNRKPVKRIKLKTV